MSLEIESLSDAIHALTEKLNGIGIEIYHFSDVIGSLNVSINKLSEKIDKDN